MKKEYRYYYKDAVSAHWMEKHYKLMYETSGNWFLDNTHKEPLVYNYVHHDAKKKNGDFKGTKFYIRRSHIHHLEPKSGDLGQDRLGMMCWFLEGKWHCDSDNEKDLGFAPAEPISILVRMGSPFIPPIAEEVIPVVVEPVPEPAKVYEPETVLEPQEKQRMISYSEKITKTMQESIYIYLMEWNCPGGIFQLPKVITDLRPYKNVSKKPVEIKNQRGLTIKLLHPQSVFDIAPIHKQLQLVVDRKVG